MLAINQLGFLLRAVVRPEDDVALARLAQARPARDGDGRAVHIGHGERARRVETDPLDICGRHVGLRECRLDGLAYARPDVGRGLLEDAVIFGIAPGRRLLCARGDERAVVLDEGGARRACADVDADVVCVAVGGHRSACACGVN